MRVRAHAARAKRMGMCKARASAGGMWGAHLRAREPRGSGLLEVVFMLASTLPRTSGCSETNAGDRNRENNAITTGLKVLVGFV